MSHKYEGFRLRLLYWVVYMGMGAFVPFRGLYFKYILKSESGSPAIEMIGIFFFIQPILGILANTVAGILADKFKMKRHILFFCLLFGAIGAIFISLPGLSLFTPWGLYQKAFMIGIGIIITGLTLSPVIPILNAETLDYLHRYKIDRGEYGQYRVLGSLSWIFISIVVGALLFFLKNVSITVYVYLGSLVFTLFFSFSGSTGAEIKKVKIPWAILLKDHLYLKFLLFAFFQGFCLVSAFNFTSYFMDDLKLNYLLIGLSFAISAAPEIHILYKAKDILNRIGSRKMIVAGTSLLILKVLLMALFAPLKNPFLVIMPMALHGVGYALQLTGFIAFIDKQAHEDLRTTYVSLFFVFSMNLADAFGGLFSSFLIKSFGSTQMMLINSVLATFSIFYFIIFVREKRLTLSKSNS